MVGDYKNPKPETQRKLNAVAAGLMAGKKKKDALVDAGYGPTNGRAMAAVKKTLKSHLERIGMTDEELAIRIKAATECSTPLVFQGKKTGDEIPDNRARIKALELCAEVMGHRPGREFSNDYDRPLNIQVNFGGTGSTAPLAHEAGLTFSIPRKPPELPSGPEPQDETLPE